MNIRETQFAALNMRSTSSAVFAGKVRPSINAAVQAISSGFAGVEVEADATGFIRSLSGTNGLFSQKFAGDAKTHAVNFLASSSVAQALDLSHVTLDQANPVVEAMPFGFRVLFNQTVKLADGTVLPVRGATVHITMDHDGKIFNVSSTLKHGRVLSIKGICSEAEAIALATTKFGQLVTKLSKTAGKKYAHDLKGAIKTCSHKVRLVASENDGRLDPVYEVTLSTCEPRQHVEFLVKAKTREVVHYQSKMHFSVSSQKQRTGLGRIAAKCFLSIPDPTKPLNQQIVDFYVENLPDSTVLANERYQMKVNEGGNWVPVKAKADGTFNFSPTGKDKDKFSAVVAFVALNLQSDINEKWGLKKQDRAIPVFVNDSTVQDNAYFDPENYEIHIGVGSGTKNGGLAEMIGFDLGVLWHENRHHQVYLQTPAHDLPGQEGGACNEATADVHGQLMMEYMFALMFTAITKKTLTVKDIVSDPRIIGMYAMPPHGIRSQRNTKTVADKDGEVHDDGEIVGGAMADALQGYVESADVNSGKISLIDQLANYGKTGQLLLALAPTRAVRFSDWRRCQITADQQLCAGVNRAVIEKAFDAHGITATAARGKGKGKGKGGKTTPRHPKAPKAPTNRKRRKTA
jgi:Zn-dependent metalloprotease